MRIPIRRILEKLESYYAAKEIDAAERLLLYWLQEAIAEEDLDGQFQIHNELMGHYRKQNNRERALLHAREALDLIERLGLSESVTAGTAKLNAATVSQAFGMPKDAIVLFEDAKRLYEKFLPPLDTRMSGLCNNMALSLVELKRFREADALYEEALKINAQRKDGKLESAITCLNLANAREAEYGLEESESEVSSLLDRAMEFLTAPDNPRDGYYAFVCEKCAPTFGYYGRFADEAELYESARRIYGKRS